MRRFARRSQAIDDVKRANSPRSALALLSKSHGAARAGRAVVAAGRFARGGGARNRSLPLSLSRLGGLASLGGGAKAKVARVFNNESAEAGVEAALEEGLCTREPHSVAAFFRSTSLINAMVRTHYRTNLHPQTLIGPYA